MPLDDTVALITGAGSGIGRALARELARNGAHVLLVGRQAAALEETLALLAPPAYATVLVCDVTDPASIADLVDAVGSFRRLDLLINNAGIMVSGPASTEDAAARRQMIETNLLGPMELTQALLPLLRAAAPARIVNIGAMFGDIAFPYFCTYSATKFGLRGWSEALRRELAPSRIAVTYAAPGTTRTPAMEEFSAIADGLGITLDSPEKTAGLIVDGILRGARDIYPRGLERLFIPLQRLMPGLLDRILIRQMAKAQVGSPAETI
ncbi:SDR family NAD(P)-dependent oxidoreductase [Telmatospirillum siberiense]|uniref:Short-chain dehydrogenase n=1 Tax=Telmatospirillum siberiense TaxID=382514 RepID=A0A2N3PNR4_9PROT|nr:SDR family NAD(P)-dependent oxidoreductase [Telmatospirillum siberiense]PKU22048.1 short-chain dehydrogenase [Telmatospirillum siberiense]